MATVQNYILLTDCNSTEGIQFASNTANELKNKHVTLVEVIQSLRHYINDEDATIRSKAINYLSRVLANLPKEFLSRQQLSVLVEFFGARVKDGGSLEALEYLQSLPRFTDEMTVATMRVLARDFRDLQVFPQSRRFEVYTVLHSLMHDHRAPLRSMEEESLSAIIEIVAGEKDPRNLMIVFSVLHAVMMEWDISGHVEALFECFFCYFPITFRPPPNDPYGVTAQNLKDRLRECIASNAMFAPYVFPQLIDRLDSPSINTKRDVLQAISACANSYGSMAMAKYGVSLWDALKFEILSEQDKEVAAESLYALKSIAKSLESANDFGDVQGPLLQFLKLVLKETKEYFEEPQQKQAQGASQILNAIASSSEVSFSLVTKEIVPMIIEDYGKAQNISQKKGLLNALQQILNAGASLQALSYGSKIGAGTHLLPYKNEILVILSKEIHGTDENEISFRLLALKCLQRSCSYQHFFSDSDVRLAVQCFNELLLTPKSDRRRELSNAAADALNEMPECRDNVILEVTLPFLTARLNTEQGDRGENYLVALEALARVGGGRGRSICDCVLRYLLTHFETAVLLNNARNIKATLVTLRRILEENQMFSMPLELEYLLKITRLISQIARAACGKENISLLNDVENMVLLGNVACLIVRRIDELNQRSVGEQIYTLYLDTYVFIGAEKRLQQAETRRQTIFLSTALLAGINKEVAIPYSTSDLPMLIDGLIELAIQETVGLIRHGLHQHICLLINKFTTAETLGNVRLVKWLVRDIQNTELVFSEQSVQTVFWVAKALILQLIHVPTVVESLVELIENPALSMSASRGFAMLLANDPVVCRENGATVRLLARQKMLSQTIPRLIETYHRSNVEIKNNCLIAFSGLLALEESGIFMVDVEQIIPLLMQSFEVDEISVRFSALKNVLVILRKSPQSLEQHIEGLISRFEKILGEPSSSNMELRFAVLKCLREFLSAFASAQIIPNQSKIMAIIATTLDDPSRLVRKEAVDCQHEWLNFGQINLEISHATKE